MALELSPNAPLSKEMLDDLSRQRVFPSRTVIYSRWGSATDFYKACGFEEKLRPSNLTNDELIDAIKDVLGEDVMPTYALLVKASKETTLPEYSSFKKRFGSLRALQQACGFETNDFGTMNAEEIVELAQSLKEQHGYDSIGKSFINEMSKAKKFPSRTIIDRIFGGGTAFQVACGEEVRGKKRSLILFLMKN